MEPGMRVFGMASASEFLGDHIVYRNLRPLDPNLPGLQDCAARLSLPTGKIPRKHELDYAHVVAVLLKAARRKEAPRQPLKRLIFVGDTELLDGAAFTNLLRVTGWTGAAFIADENPEAPQCAFSQSTAGGLFLANRWSALPAFDSHCRDAGQPVDVETAVVIDLDKTILGARRRNSKMIDWSRARAMELTIVGLLGENFDPQAFQEAYHAFNQPAFHPFTSDNQDYLAYVCLVVLAGVVDPAQLAQSVHQGEVSHFEQFISQMDGRQSSMPPALRQAHQEVFACVQAGDPTPFKAFRFREYQITVSVMGFLGAGASVEALLEQEITLTQEVRQMALEWKRRGALVFGLSDKPDEAAIPSAEMAAQGYQPLHRALTHAVGA
jgi:hypothetical protein